MEKTLDILKEYWWIATAVTTVTSFLVLLIKNVYLVSSYELFFMGRKKRNGINFTILFFGLMIAIFLFICEFIFLVSIDKLTLPEGSIYERILFLLIVPTLIGILGYGFALLLVFIFFGRKKYYLSSKDRKEEKKVFCDIPGIYYIKMKDPSGGKIFKTVDEQQVKNQLICVQQREWVVKIINTLRNWFKKVFNSNKSKSGEDEIKKDAGR